jgi:hypothetical protein
MDWIRGLLEQELFVVSAIWVIIAVWFGVSQWARYRRRL